MNQQITPPVNAEFAAAYQRALGDFVLTDAGETALMNAYQLGRRAVSEQRSILDLAALHQNVMLNTVLRETPQESEAAYLARGEEFFGQVMAPFEMMHRGYADTIRQLQTVNQTLEQRVADRTSALQVSERRAAGLARLYAILSGINSAIVRLRDRDELFREACRIAVEQGHFATAWISLCADGEVQPPQVSCSQGDNGHAFDLPAVADAAAGLAEALAQVAKTNKALIRRSGAAVEAQALALLPLHLEGTVVGVFAIFSTDPQSFDTEEVRLLDELAGDISFALEHIKKEEQLAYAAYYDALTDLPNLTLLMERLTRQLRSTASGLVAVLLVDLVRFSDVNDTYGRHVGDLLLKAVATALRAHVEARDTVARTGADHFGVLMAGLHDADQVAYRLEREILAAFASPFVVDGNEIHLSAQVGISLYPLDAADADALYKNAEIAVKRAQSEGESYLMFNPQMNEQIVRAVTLESKLRKALEQDDLLVYYQPKVSADDNRIVGMEALVRYQDPDDGLVAPDQFVPLLEETGMIIEVGRWVLERAANDLRRWRDNGLRPPRIAVNVSPIQLRHREFLQTLQETADRFDREALELDLEITEGAVMDDVEANIPKLAAAREMGYRIAIDDFGTGYSSLAYLTKLPVNALKIDRSFIIGMADNPNSLAIVSSIISLAHSLGLEVVAEGVERDEQAKLLRLLRCEQIQGNLFSRALPADQLAALLTRSL